MRLTILLGPVLGLCLMAGCGRSEAPTGTNTPPSAPAAPQRPSSVVNVPPDSAQLRQIQVQPVQLGEIPTDELVAPGRVSMNPNRVSRVLPQVPGRVVKVMARLGDAVEQGQPLVELESPDADAAVSTYRQAQAAESQARAALTKAEADLARAKDLYEVRAVAEKDVLNAQHDLAQAKGGLETAAAVRQQAWRKLELLGLTPKDFHQPVFVRAPLSGKVLEVNVAPGEYRAAISFHTDTTAPLMIIADLSTVWVSSDVPEPFIRLIHMSEPVSISLVSFPDEVFVGKVARIGDVLDPQTHTLKVHVELPNPQGRFRPEMFGSLRHSGPKQMMPVVPTAAVVQEYGRNIVFLERASGQYERRQVTVGSPVKDLLPVLSGLQAGDRIVVDGAMLLKDR